MSTRPCLLCAAVEETDAAPFRRLFGRDQVASEFLVETDGFVVVADVAPVSDGHLLLVSQDHVPSFASLDRKRLQEAAALDAVLGAALTDAYTLPVLRFEHGSPDSGRRRAACIDHAHLHFVPSSFAPHALEGVGAGRRIETLEDLAEAGAAEYLLINRADGAYRLHEVDGLQSQHVRRELCRHAGDERPWAWRMHLKTESARKRGSARLLETWRRVLPGLRRRMGDAGLKGTVAALDRE